MSIFSLLSQPANYIRILIFLSFLWCCFFYVRKRENLYVILILIISSLCEIFSFFFGEVPKINHANVNTYFIFLNVLWLLILHEFSYNKKRLVLAIVGYLIFSILNLEFFEDGINYNLFIAGALLYLIMFIIESFYHLNKENLTVFQSNNYFLLFCPVMFFMSLSFIFGFKSSSLSKTPILGGFTLYQFMNYPVNILYYTFINWYMFKEKRNKINNV